MEFFIRQGSTDPILKLKLIDDGKNDKMFDVTTQQYHVLNGTCLLTTRTKKYDQTTDEYYITYRFKENDTSIKGRFEGLVTIQFLDTNSNPTHKLIVPIKEKLIINVV